MVSCNSKPDKYYNYNYKLCRLDKMSCKVDLLWLIDDDDDYLQYLSCTYLCALSRYKRSHLINVMTPLNKETLFVTFLLELIYKGKRRKMPF